MTREPAPLDVLVVCTGNLNRSPIAARLLDAELRRRGVDAHVHSAGFVTEDLPAPEHALTVIADRGLDLSRHRSRRLDARLLRSADLVLAMERRHVREVAVLDRDAFARTFTLPELARRAAVVGPRPAGCPLQDWLDRVGAGRTAAELLGSDPVDDVPDPHRQALGAYRRTLDALDDLVTRVVDLLVPDQAGQGRGGSSAR